MSRFCAIKGHSSIISDKGKKEKGTISTLSSTISSLSTRVDDCEGDLSDFGDNISELDERLSSVESNYVSNSTLTSNLSSYLTTTSYANLGAFVSSSWTCVTIEEGTGTITLTSTNYNNYAGMFVSMTSGSAQANAATFVPFPKPYSSSTSLNVYLPVTVLTYGIILREYFLNAYIYKTASASNVTITLRNKAYRHFSNSSGSYTFSAASTTLSDNYDLYYCFVRRI